MKIRFFIYLPFWIISLPGFGQFSTDFSEGNLEIWQGDKANFVINAGKQLQLNAPEGSTASWLYTPVNFTDSMVWEIYIKLGFAPSTSNQLKIFLGVTAPDLTTASGYYLEIGASGDQDPLELKYLNNGETESLAASLPGLVSMDPIEMVIRIIKKENGTWQVFKVNGISAELLLTTLHDETPLSELAYFGLDCNYTSTRRDKFFFDDINIMPLAADTLPPICLDLTVLNKNSVQLTFNELLEEHTAMDTANYFLSPGNLLLNEIEIHQADVILSWNDNFVSQQEYTLSIERIKDQAGNTIIPIAKNFIYIAIDQAQPNELLITEIMADPSPAIGLPEAEYLEIHNATDGVFRLSDYTLQVGSTIRALPNELIPDGAYVLLCDEDNKALFENFGHTIGIASFPGLTNSGTSVKILNSDDASIHEVDYNISWYGDATKTDGGWSLEMKNPMHICSDSDNWSACSNLSGGTPGSINSQWETSSDTEGPQLISLYSPSPQSIFLRFSEQLDAILMENPSAYSINPSIGISSAILTDAKTIALTLVSPMAEGVIYNMLSFDAFDCLGNVRNIPASSSFGVTEAIAKGDVLINEILFNPATGGSRFVEIINVSQKFIDLGTLAVGQIGSTQNAIYPTAVNEIVRPGQLVVLTPNPADISERYFVPDPNVMFEAPLPLWNATSGNVSLLSNGIIIDSFTYYASWHLPVIADQNGVSLERISSLSPTSSSSSWHSASSVDGYATPTGANSQQTTFENEGESPFSITHSVFSPDGDGFKDFLALNFLLNSGDFIGSVWVYDLEGREINRLLSNESLGTSALVQWDGRNKDQLLADMGIYVLFIQLWDASGNVKEYKETCALVKR